jgi:ribosomal protein S18 acetylase RimI-like enzyme
MTIMTAPDRSPSVPVTIRGSHDNDIPTLLAIEQEAFEYPWSEVEFLGLLRKPNRYCYVALAARQRVVGFLVVEATGRAFHVLTIAVHPAHRLPGPAGKPWRPAPGQWP